MTRLLPAALSMFLSVALVPAEAREAEDPLSELATSRTTGDPLVPWMEALAEASPELCACVLGELLRGAPWPHEGFQRNEKARQVLAERMADHDVAPDPECRVPWEEHVSSPGPPRADDALGDLSLADKQRWLMHIALHAAPGEELVVHLIGLGESEQDPRAQNLALMAAARLLARSPGKMDSTAGALLALLRQRGRIQGRDDLGYTLSIAGVLATSRPRLAELLLAQYDPADDEAREWILRVWSETDFRRLDAGQRRRTIDALIASGSCSEYRWQESAVLAHIESLTGSVHPVVTEMMASDDESERLCGIRWAAAGQIEPDEMWPRYVEHYRSDTPAVRATALWGIGRIVGANGRYGDVAPLLPDLLDDLQGDSPELREAAATLLRRLVSKECREPGVHEGLGAILPALAERLATADPARRQHLLQLLRDLPDECLSRELSRAAGER